MRSEPHTSAPESHRVPLKTLAIKIRSGATPRGGANGYLNKRARFALVRSQNVLDHMFTLEGLANISDSQAAELDGVHLQADDVLLNITGDGATFGRSCLVPSRVLPACVNQHVMLIRVDRAKCVPGYLASWLALPETKSYIESFNAGGSRRAITKGHIESFLVPMLPLDTQVAIAKIAGELNAQIDLLQETNTTLEAIAQAIFKSWFIDFDPVHAKAKGLAPEGMDEATAALFPDSFDESALGAIPRGWNAVELNDLCSRISNGSTPARMTEIYWSRGTIPWFKTGELFDGFLLQPSERITPEAVASTSVKVLPRHAVLMAIYAAPTVGRLGVLAEPATFNQACCGMVASDEVGPWFLFQTLKNGREWFNGRANGAAQQNISKAIVEKYVCVKPEDGVLRSFNQQVEPIYALIENNSREVKTLKELRDTLLPRIISGKLRIPKAEELIEEFVGELAA